MVNNVQNTGFIVEDEDGSMYHVDADGYRIDANAGLLTLSFSKKGTVVAVFKHWKYFHEVDIVSVI